MAFVPPASRAALCGGNKHFPSSTSSPSHSVKLQLRVNDDDDEVNVNLIPDVDAFTLTAVGFGLIAFNFFVLANVSIIVPLASLSSSVHGYDTHR